jgi:hypothetical protein
MADENPTVSRLQTPHNEAEVLPMLSEPQAKRYAHFKAGAERVAAKYPDQDTAIYTDYLTEYLESAKNFKIETRTSDGLPVDRRFIDERLEAHDRELQQRMVAKYPAFFGNDPTPEEKKTAETNERSFRRFRTEVMGEGLIESAGKHVYDEEKGGWQWGKISGGLAGGAIGLLMASMIGAAAGGGWLGTLLMVILGGAGMMFGANLVDGFMNPEKKNEAGGKERSQNTPGQQQQIEGDAPSQEQTTSRSSSQNVAPQPAANTIKKPNSRGEADVPVTQLADGSFAVAKDPRKALFMIETVKEGDRFDVKNIGIPNGRGGFKYRAVNGMALQANADGALDLNENSGKVAQLRERAYPGMSQGAQPYQPEVPNSPLRRDPELSGPQSAMKKLLHDDGLDNIRNYFDPSSEPMRRQNLPPIPLDPGKIRQ